MKLAEVFLHRSLRGVAVKSCIENDKPMGDIAHAHFAADDNFGWVCIANVSDFNSTTVLHEIAHILRRNDRHDEAWKKTVRTLGGRVERRYRKKP